MRTNLIDGAMYYEVLTWDVELQKWTPQQGVRRGPYTKWGVRRALRKLREFGYDGTMSDVAVLVDAWTRPEKRARKRKKKAHRRGAQSAEVLG